MVSRMRASATFRPSSLSYFLPLLAVDKTPSFVFEIKPTLFFSPTATTNTRHLGKEGRGGPGSVGEKAVARIIDTTGTPKTPCRCDVGE